MEQNTVMENHPHFHLVTNDVKQRIEDLLELSAAPDSDRNRLKEEAIHSICNVIYRPIGKLDELKGMHESILSGHTLVTAEAAEVAAAMFEVYKPQFHSDNCDCTLAAVHDIETGERDERAFFSRCDVPPNTAYGPSFSGFLHRPPMEGLWGSLESRESAAPYEFRPNEIGKAQFSALKTEEAEDEKSEYETCEDEADEDATSANETSAAKKYKYKKSKNEKFKDGKTKEKSKDESEDQLSEDQLSKDQLSKDQLSKDQSSKDQSSEDQSSEDQSSEDQSSKDQSPEDQSPEDQSPEDQSPEDQSPEDQSPEDQSPEDQSPEDQSPEDEESALRPEMPQVDRSKCHVTTVKVEESVVTPRVYIPRVTKFFCTDMPHSFTWNRDDMNILQPSQFYQPRTHSMECCYFRPLRTIHQTSYHFINCKKASCCFCLLCSYN